nr:MAG TPA: hypothetical protein [Caudoviricetes sp.]DAI16635.1 MAG TPA: hypothetical protein [Caudoviricetes sp.]DAT59586.1 MAG TPA: hypothetical protein [Caudoviricetes sp.]DAW43573.1 MAG TPA: hypothetical protein [Caudoviricetes sp.]
MGEAVENNIAVIAFLLITRIATLVIFTRILFKQFSLLQAPLEPEVIPTRNALIAIMLINALAQLMPIALSVLSLGTPPLHPAVEIFYRLSNSTTDLCAAIGFWLIYRDKEL